MNAIHNVVAMDYCVEIHRVYWMLLRLLYVYMFTVTVDTENKRQGIWIICYCWYSCRKCCCWVCGRGDSTQGSKQTTWSQWHGLHSWNTGAIHVVDGILFNRRNMTIRTCIDATNFGNESRFINHACESNCGILLVGVWTGIICRSEKDLLSRMSSHCKAFDKERRGNHHSLWWSFYTF